MRSSGFCDNVAAMELPATAGEWMVMMKMIVLSWKVFLFLSLCVTCGSWVVLCRQMIE